MFRKISTFLAGLAFVAVLAFGQANPQTVFDNAYWASQPPAVRVLRTHNTFDVAAQLASQGYAIDNAIMVWGWDPYLVMQQRVAEKLTWIPVNFENPIGCVPGSGVQSGSICYALPGLTPIGGQLEYPVQPPAHLVTVKVSINPDDFPPYVAPVVEDNK